MIRKVFETYIVRYRRQGLGYVSPNSVVFNDNGSVPIPAIYAIWKAVPGIEVRRSRLKGQGRHQSWIITIDDKTYRTDNNGLLFINR
jgi:hypothetical protein